MHAILESRSASGDESNCFGKLQRKRIVSIMTRLIQRTDRIADGTVEYE